MPSLSADFLYLLRDDYKKYGIFVESGTFRGETILTMEPHFKKLHTVDVSERYWLEAKEKYDGNKITFHWADSEKIFPELLPTLNEPAIFFLDGHWSGWDTGLGVRTVPLLEEVSYINRHFRERAILIIDDFRLFGSPYWEYINKPAILSLLIERLDSVYHLPSVFADNDRLVIHILPRDGEGDSAIPKNVENI